MPAWSLLASNNTPEFGSEQWAFVGIPGDSSHVAYAVRLVVPNNTPESWNTGGFFGLYQVVVDRLVMGRTYPIPLAGRGENQLLRLVGAGDIDLVSQGLVTFGVVYYVHRWVTASSIEVWVLA